MVTEERTRRRYEITYRQGVMSRETYGGGYDAKAEALAAARSYRAGLYQYGGGYVEVIDTRLGRCVWHHAEQTNYSGQIVCSKGDGDANDA